MQNPVIDEYGNQLWFNEDGELHREDGPAVLDTIGAEEWYLNGKRHREDGPAYLHPGVSEEWYLNGQLHRVGGPAVSTRDTDIEMWYLHGKLHREDGPAVVLPSGHKEYYLHGEKVEELPCVCGGETDLIDTDLDLAILAKGAFNEGVAAQRKAEREFERTGVFAKPVNPYVPIALRLIRERDGARH